MSMVLGLELVNIVFVFTLKPNRLGLGIWGNGRRMGNNPVLKFLQYLVWNTGLLSNIYLWSTSGLI